MEYKLLEEKDLILMENVLKDDNMVFNLEYLNKFLSEKNSYGLLQKMKIKL